MFISISGEDPNVESYWAEISTKGTLKGRMKSCQRHDVGHSKHGVLGAKVNVLFLQDEIQKFNKSAKKRQKSQFCAYLIYFFLIPKTLKCPKVIQNLLDTQILSVCISSFIGWNILVSRWQRNSKGSTISVLSRSNEISSCPTAMTEAKEGDKTLITSEGVTPLANGLLAVIW